MALLGQVVAAAGHLVVVAGHVVAFEGHAVDFAGQVVAALGHFVATPGHFVATDGITVTLTEVPPTEGFTTTATSVAENASSLAWAVVTSRPRHRPAATAEKHNHRFMVHLLQNRCEAHASSTTALDYCP